MNKSYIGYYASTDRTENVRDFLRTLRIIIFAGTKFIFDRLLAVLGMILLSPVMLIIAIAIKLDSKGPILFKQVRTGKNGKNFTMYKFRTMVESNDVHDFEKSDEHTKIGRILRKTSMDELPQLYAIAIGKMSFIGPRPWITDYYDNMSEEQRYRYAVRPGLTGLAQTMGRNDISIFKKLEYDFEYIQNYSLYQDLKILFLTIKAVFTGKGADAGKETIQKELNDLAKHNKEWEMSR